MNEEDVKKFFEEIGLVKGLENMKKFQEEFIDKHYIEKKKVKEVIERFEKYHFDDIESDHPSMLIHHSDFIALKKGLGL